MEDQTIRPLERVLYAIDLDPSRKFGSMEEQLGVLSAEFRSYSSVFIPLFSTAPDASSGAELRAAGLDWRSLDLGRFRWSTLVRLLRLIREEQIDVVHWNFYHPLNNPYIWFLSLLAPGVKHDYTDHISRPASEPAPAAGWGRRMKRLVKRLLLRRYRRAFCISDYVRHQLARQEAWPALERCHYFVNTDRFAPDAAVRSEMRARFGGAGRFVVLVVAHLIPQKGLEVAVRALGALPDSIVLWIVGDGPEAGRLQERIARDGLTDRARFLGRQRRVERFLQAADCFVCPSLWAEAVGLVNLEALCCGLPVVASKTGGIPEFVEEGVTGFLFPPGDDARLAAILQALADDPETVRRIGLQARAVALERHATAVRLPEYLEFHRVPVLSSKGHTHVESPVKTA